jgi:predicted GNAT family N-acyltransferase
MSDGFRIEIANWGSDEAELYGVRERVFVIEQQVPREEEIDEFDPVSLHVLARDDAGQPIGTGRLTPQRKIGRMAVLAGWRGRGVGDAILRTLIEQARARYWPDVALHAQVSATDFYSRTGFVPEGEDFVEAGIVHRTMRLALPLAERLDRPGDHATPVPAAQAVEVASLASAHAFVDELLADARHRVWVYTRDLDRLLLDRETVLEALRRIALSGRNADIRILVLEPAVPVRDSHRLLHLAARLSSHFQLRTPVVEEDRQYASAFLLNDVGGYYFRPIGARYEGEGNRHGPGRHGQLLAHFGQVWERSEPDPELRRMAL